MAYKGGVPVNSGFYPRNDFPIADAKDIYFSDTERLDVVVGELIARLAQFNTTFIGTRAEYEAANKAGSVPVGAVVYITDDDASVSAGATSSVLGVAVLGQMILG